MIDDKFFLNSFIDESFEMLFISIDLFQRGYFDCAFFCLRSSIEISTTMVYLSDGESRTDLLKKWRTKDEFPFRSRMVKDLSHYDGVYLDM